MTTLEHARQIVSELSRDEREILGIELLATLEKDPGCDEYWEAEIARRVEDMDKGTATYMSWEDVRRKMRETLHPADQD